MKKSLIKNSLLLIGGVAFLIAVWTTAYFCVGNKVLVPSVLETIAALGKTLIDGAFWLSFFATLLRVVIAFILSFVVATGAAVLSYLYPSFRTFIRPVFALFRAMPVLAVLLIILVWTNETVAPVIVAFLSLCPILYTATLTALDGVDSELLEMSRVYQVPLRMQIKKLYIPSVLPAITKESGAALGFAVKLVVSAEVLARTASSLGVLMQDMQDWQLPYLFALVIVACLLGFALETTCEILAKRLQGGAK